jgi:alpha-L-rhamnosidase
MPSPPRAERLRCNHLTDPAAVDDDRPTLSWTGADAPARIVVASSLDRLATPDLWDSGFVSVGVPHLTYAGTRLTLAQQAWWRVELRSGDTIAHSNPATWTRGPAPGDWRAAWIGMAGLAPSAQQRLPVFRHTVSIAKPVRSAVAFVSGLGHYELLVNGVLASHRCFDPAWSDYDRTVYYAGVRLTTLMRAGTNALAIRVGHGMHHTGGSKRYKKFRRSFGPSRVILQLHITYDDGNEEIIATDDATWRVAPGTITHSCIYGGEDEDARLLPPDWMSAEFDDSNWALAAKVEPPRGTLRAALHPGIFRGRALLGTAMPGVTPHVTVFDLGRNIAGVPRVLMVGSAGSSVTIRPGEVLDAAGRVSQANIGGPMYYKYTTAGRPLPQFGDTLTTWEPSFSYTGFRYLEIETEGDASVGPAHGIEIESNVDPVGTFECSDPLLNRIHDLIDNAIRSNLQAVLTDCPHREKLGWLEQTHLMAPSLLCRYDLLAYYRKICADMRDAQHDDGCVPTIAPQFTRFEKPWDVFNDSPEWGAAIVLAPWHAYRASGERTILEENYDAMVRFERYLTSRADEHGIVAYGLGDWYDIGPGDPGFGKLTTLGVTGTATLFECRTALARIATILGHSPDAERFAINAEKTRADFERRYFDQQANHYDRGSQCAQAMPLALGICSTPARREAALAQLVADIRARGNHVSAGDVGFHYVIDALSMHDRDDVIYDMVVAPEPPSYAAQLAAGATTLTEAWDANPTKSLNHLMLGHAMAWLHERLGGIRVDCTRAGPERITIAPARVGATNAQVERVTPWGRVSAEWSRPADRPGTMKVEISAGATVTVVWDQKAQVIGAGRHELISGE